MKVLLVTLFSLFFLNLVILNYFVFFKKSSPPISAPLPTPTPPLPTPTTVPTLTLSPTKNPISIPKQKPLKSVSYVPIPGSGSVLATKWTDISGTDFYFDTNDYPYLKEAYFSASIKLFNGNGTAFVRLFDVTAGIEVWGSEVKTNNQNLTFITSNKLTLRSGNHLYRVQGKSLTADTTVFNSGQLRLISQN